jgi:hypothetical protein
MFAFTSIIRARAHGVTRLDTGTPDWYRKDGAVVG